MQIKYFSGAVEIKHIRALKNAEFAARFPGVAGFRFDGFKKLVGYAEGATKDGDELPVTRKIEFKSNPSLHKCDARCQNAKGRTCECSCGGQFHGFGSAGAFRDDSFRVAA